MTQSILLDSVRLFLIPRKMDEDSCSQQGGDDSFLVLDQANQQPQLVEHDTVSTLVVLGTTSLDHQLTQDSWLTIRDWNILFRLSFSLTDIDLLTWNKRRAMAD